MVVTKPDTPKDMMEIQQQISLLKIRLREMKDSINRVPTKTLATKKCGEDDGLMSGLEVVEQKPEKRGNKFFKGTRRK